MLISLGPKGVPHLCKQKQSRGVVIISPVWVGLYTRLVEQAIRGRSASDTAPLKPEDLNPNDHSHRSIVASSGSILHINCLHNAVRRPKLDLPRDNFTGTNMVYWPDCIHQYARERAHTPYCGAPLEVDEALLAGSLGNKQYIHEGLPNIHGAPTEICLA